MTADHWALFSADGRELARAWQGTREQAQCMAMLQAYLRDAHVALIAEADMGACSDDPEWAHATFACGPSAWTIGRSAAIERVLAGGNLPVCAVETLLGCAPSPDYRRWLVERVQELEAKP